ncbi:MAG TPA: TonB-dependent receptor [Terriglobales bacterium]|nr:TonB-dependent receptor [Terriglobales bacterium]
MRMQRAKRAFYSAVLSSVLLFPSLVQAQYSSNVQGFVLDPSGAAVADASVTLRNVDTGVESTTKTSASGNYRFSSLQPGNYVVAADAGGFKNTQVNFTLSTGQTQGIDIHMTVASASTQLTVTTEAAQLDVDENRIQDTLSSTTVRDLPQLNRNLWDVLAVTPGVVGTGTRGPGESPGGGADNFGTQTPQLSANGRSYTGNLVMVDGMNVTSPVQNGNIILAPIPDAVQEASLQANSWDAENNLGSSILIQVTTKSGTNQFHGTGSLFFTNQNLQARQEFVSPNQAFTPFARKDLVGTLGGPIVKNKTFFFADVEKLWSTTPTAVGANGSAVWESPQFAAWAQQNFPNTVGTQVLQLYPATFDRPNGNIETAQTYFANQGLACGTAAAANIPCNLPMLAFGNFSASPSYNALQYNFRLDQYFTQNDRLYLSYYNDSFDQEQLAPRAGLQAEDIMRNRYGQADFTHTFNSNLLWESSFAFASVGGANGQDANLRVPEIAVNDGSQGFHIGGGWGPGEYRGPMYNWRSVMSMIRGAHTLKFGFDGGHGIEHGNFTPVNVRPSFTFNNLLSLVQDNPVSESVGAYNPLTGLAGTQIFGGQATPFGFFGQDDWKVKPNFSLTLSLRWDDFTNHTPWGNSGFQFSSLILGSGSTFAQQVASAGVHPVPAVFAHSLTNLWSPRVGFAWDPTKTGKWSIRGGIGVFHDWVVLGQTVDQTRNNPPGVISPTFTTGGTGPQPIFALAPSGTYPFGFPLPAIPAGQLNAQGGIVGIQAAVDSLNRNFKAPLAANYVIGVEHQLPWRLVAGVNYSGSRSYNGLTGTDVNRCTRCATLTGSGENITRPNPNFGSIDYVTNENAGTYNAMIFSLRGNAGARGNFQASYTLSHAKDYPEAGTRFDQDTSPFGTAYNIPDPNAYSSYYSDANWDVRRRFSMSAAYNLPGLHSGIAKVLTSGWEVTSIAVAQSGTPFWVINNLPLTAGGDYNQDGVAYDVPNAPSQNFTGSHSRQAYEAGLFTSADFPAPPAGTEGNLKRNTYRNPGLVQVDASVLKNNHLPWLGEQGNLQFRFDFLNAFNHVNLGSVDNFMGDANFGRVTSALSARQLQLGLRIAF